MKILAIETSCDETAIAILEFSGPKIKPDIKVLSNIVSSQVKLHAKFGGVVPNLAKREHQKNLSVVLLNTLKRGGFLISKSEFLISKQIPKYKTQKVEKIFERETELLEKFKKRILFLKPPGINAISVTYGPGLAPALWVGVNFAKALAYLWDKPLIPVNHMEGHIFSAFLRKSGKNNSKFKIQNSKFPAIALLVSGGHTELVLMRGYGKYKIIGETVDDAAGEAFDKVARLLGLGYPGGPAISTEAEMKIKNQKSRQRRGSPQAAKIKINLPRPMINSRDFKFSFSGLKTSVFYLTRDFGKRRTRLLRPIIAKEFQDAVVEVLVKKTVDAAKKFKAKTIILGGGVAANKLLRKRLTKEMKKNFPLTNLHLPLDIVTGDNALMIAIVAYFSGKKKALDKVGADANARLGT